jgi:2-haloacid dehalogenase
VHDGINIKEQSIVDAHYTDFRSITEDALLFDAKTLKLELRDNPRDQLMQVWLEIKASP